MLVAFTLSGCMEIGSQCETAFVRENLQTLSDEYAFAKKSDTLDLYAEKLRSPDKRNWLVQIRDEALVCLQLEARHDREPTLDAVVAELHMFRTSIPSASDPKRLLDHKHDMMDHAIRSIDKYLTSQ